MDNKPIKTLIVDDESLARNLLETLVQRDPSLQLVGQCGDGGTALAMISDLSPDLVFLDVEMPTLNGIGVVERLLHRKHVPYIVFVTAFNEYAVKAFELNVLDYLLKPIEKARFFPAVERAKAAIKQQQICDLATRMLGVVSAYKDMTLPSPSDERILINTGQKLVSLDIQDIIWVQAANQYVHIHTASEVFVMSENLSHFSKRLNEIQFVRVHRSAIINLTKVQFVSRKGSGAHQVTLTGNAQVPVARGRADLLPLLLNAAQADQVT